VTEPPARGSAREVLAVALRLGLTSFGGPVAHLGYFRAEYVQRRRWLSDEAYAELVAISQALPGPASSKVGMAVGYVRAGWAGGLAAWLGFTLPSVVALAVLAALAADAGLGTSAPARALALVAIAVVTDAVLGMASRLATTWRTRALAVAALAGVLVLPGPFGQVLVLAAAAVAGVLLCRSALPPVPAHLPVTASRRAGLVALAAFGLLLLAVPAVSRLGTLGELAAAHYRAGALVFGGGHVVLPLLREPLVPGLLTDEQFLAGYGAAQAVPGPLFSFAAYVGQVVAGVPGAVVATICIFLPGALVLAGVLPFWAAVRADRRIQAALVGVNAAVVGLLAAALVDLVVTTGGTGWREPVFALALLALLRLARWPSWAVVVAALAASPLLLLGSP
jgi:chromate transporter